MGVGLVACLLHTRISHSNTLTPPERYGIHRKLVCPSTNSRLISFLPSHTTKIEIFLRRCSMYCRPLLNNLHNSVHYSDRPTSPFTRNPLPGTSPSFHLTQPKLRFSLGDVLQASFKQPPQQCTLLLPFLECDCNILFATPYTYVRGHIRSMTLY